MNNWLRNKNLLTLAILLFISVSFLSFNKYSDRYFEIAKNLDIFATLFKEVNAYYVDEVNPNKLIKTGIDAMLQSLDPYTNYIPEDDIEDFRTLSTGQYGGIGAVTNKIDNRVLITMIFEGYAAHKGGLKIGDEVIMIDGIDIENKTRDEVSHLMKGQLGTIVTLTVKRYGYEDPIDIQLKREKIKVNNVPFYGIIGEDVGYIKLSDFTLNAGEEVAEAVKDLKKNGAARIILDLRGNPGGLLMEAINVTNVFIPKNEEIVSTRGKVTENNAKYKTLNSSVDTEIPLAVLINRGSASASEIVAGTIQDLDRGILVGERSFGKGLVQITRPLSYNSQLKVTTAKYYIPSGRSIQAIDYSQRREDGSVHKIPDSLKVAFKTKNGRTVYDGGGINPDVTVVNEELPTIGYVLSRKGLIIDYGNKFVYENEGIPPAQEFNLSDKEYEDFMSWAAKKDFRYTTKLERSVNNLIASAKEEKYYKVIEGQIENLKTSVQESKSKDLLIFKDDIKILLEEEIASRYYFQKGAVEVNFGEDHVIQESIKVLKNSSKYKEILSAN